MLRRLTVAGLMAASLLGLGACDLFQKVEVPKRIDAPEAKLLGVSLVEQTATGIRVEIVVELSNENGVSLPLKETSYKIKLGDSEAVSLVDDANRTVPARGKQIVRLPASVSLGDAGSGRLGFSASGSVAYDPPGEWRDILSESGVPLPKSSFKGEGYVQ